MSDYAVLDCIHGIDLCWPCLCCQELAAQMEKAYLMQTRDTFPELTIKQPKGGKVGCKTGKGGKKR